MSRTVSLWGPVILFMGIIFYLSAQPDVPIPAGTDKSFHSIGYTILSVLIVRALAGGLPARITVATALLAVALATAYGVTDEFHQSFVPGRTAELNDLLADAIGAVTGAFACWLWGILFPSRHGL